MATDAAIRCGLSVPRLAAETMEKMRDALPATANLKNPVDVIGDARADRYTAALEAVLDDPNIDQTLVILTPQSMTDIESIARGICKFHETATKPIACSFMGAADVGPGIRLLQQAHIPHYILPEWACEAMAYVQRIRQWREQPMVEFEPLPVDRQAARAIIDQRRERLSRRGPGPGRAGGLRHAGAAVQALQDARRGRGLRREDRLSGGAARGQPADHSQVGGAGRRLEPGRRRGGPRRVRADAAAPGRRRAGGGDPRHVGPPHDPAGLRADPRREARPGLRRRR